MWRQQGVVKASLTVARHVPRRDAVALVMARRAEQIVTREG